jgi:hypothetical protein
MSPARKRELQSEPTNAETRAERVFVGYQAAAKAELMEWQFHRREAERHSKQTVRPPAMTRSVID